MSSWHWNTESKPAAQDVSSTMLPETAADWSRADDVDLDLVHVIHQKLIADIDPDKLKQLSREQARESVQASAKQIIAEIAPFIVGETRDVLLDAVSDEVLGLGPIEKLVADPDVSEVMVNEPDLIYWEEAGVIYKSRLRFRDADHVMRIVQRIVAPLGRRVDESSPYVDARLPDGSRVNVIIPPIAYKSPVLTIRKFLGDKYTAADLVGVGTMTDSVSDFLAKAIKAKLNILISGGTGTGKTTLLSALSAHIGESERIITIEDPVELKLQQAPSS